ncbi:tetratricopeptide repeat protein [Sphingomonas sp. BIUV-7]|uniref:Tetratricopeptide repeat protein n=1 Tax=Sphingomonas natans TaxID=3063330 RepID=A0ABT8Y8W7_9SPHN|nr:tetratricopeptide repeat protein [Sphingomonas sp. BIUV-7]MDO6414773.1 tetratricopeptide repeat protein [Sphingomonas sp. BIUV-7]
MADGGGFGASRIGLYALVLAGVAAVVALGLRYREGGVDKGAAPSAAAPAATPGDVSGMIAALEAKLKANPKDTEGWRMLGWSYFNLNRFADAAKAYARATEQAPRDASLWSALGETLVYAHQKGVDDDAAHAFGRAVEIDPKDARARYFLAVRKDLQGDHKGAIDDWIAVLRDAPADAPYAESIRTLIEKVSKREKIDVAGRIPTAPAPVSVASDAIPGPTPNQMQDAARMTPTQQDALARGMVDRLAARLTQQPHDEEGWIRLMRAKLVLGDAAGAKDARAKARAAFAGDASALGRIDAAAKELGVG